MIQAYRAVEKPVCFVTPRKRGSRNPQETWIPASAGMTIETVSGLFQQAVMAYRESYIV
jgi:hypothetical protein